MINYYAFQQRQIKIKQYYFNNYLADCLYFTMSRKPSFQADLSISARLSYSQKASNQPYSHRKYPVNYDKYSSQVQDRSAFEDTHYTTTQQEFSGIRKLPDNISSVRETFSYVPSKSNQRFESESINNYNYEPNSKQGDKLGDVLRQTMDLRSIKRKQQLNLGKSESGSLSFNQAAFIRSERQISNQLYGQNIDKRYSKNNNKGLDIKSYGHISKSYNQVSYSANVQEQIRKIRQQRQKRKANKPIDFQQSSPYIKSLSKVAAQKQQFAKKNYVQYYTPKVQKTNYNDRFVDSNVLSPQYEKQKKQTSFDNQCESPKKLSDINALKVNLQKKPIQVYKQSKSKGQSVKLQDFYIGKVLGQGKFGTAHMAFHKSTGSVFAIKKVKKEVIKSNKLIDQFILQVKLQSFLSHPFILKIFGLFDDKTYIYIVLEFLEQGTLFNYLKKFKKLTENDTAQKVRYLAESIKYLQDRGIAHRDIKPENIIVTNDVCKLADFGWATFCDEERRKTYCGTCDYVAPQILQGQQYDQTVDLWCIGVLAYELMTGKAPFYHMSMKQTKKKIINLSVTYPQDFSQNLKTFIAGLIQKDPEQRMSIEQVLIHPFLKNVELAQ